MSTVDVNAVIKNIIEGNQVEDNCEVLVVELRNENTRKSPEINNSIPSLCRRTVLVIEDFHHDKVGNRNKLQQVMKVLVNSSANANRSTFINQDSKFWSSIVSLLGEAVYAEIFVLQFCRETDKKKHYVKTLKENGLFDKLKYLLVETNSESIDDIYEEYFKLIEIITEIAETELLEIDDKFLKMLLEFPLQDTEEYEELSRAIEILTSYNKSLTSASINILFDTLDYNQVEGSLYSKHLFGAIGNISAEPSFDNWACLGKCIDVLNRNANVDNVQAPNQYVCAAAQVILGNCVESLETRDKMINELVSRLEGDVVKLILWPPKTDVIQYQGVFHLLKQIMVPEIAQQVLTYHEIFANTCKVVIDNKTYYADIHKQMIKCVRKLLLAYDGSVSMYVGDLCRVFDKEPEIVGGLVAQKFITEVAANEKLLYEDTSLIKKILASIIDETEISLDGILDKLKSLAIFFTKINLMQVRKIYQQDEIKLTEEFLDPIDKYLTKLLETIKSTPNMPEILINNSAYVGVVGSEFFKEFPNSHITQVCENLTALKAGEKR